MAKDDNKKGNETTKSTTWVTTKDSEISRALKSLQSRTFNKQVSSTKDRTWKTSKDLSTWLTSSATSTSTISVQNDISNLRNELNEKLIALSKNEDTIETKSAEIEELTKTLDDIQDKQSIQHLLDSVSDKAHEKIMSDDDYKDLFYDEKEIKSYVVSIDIRRSTELMLKATSAQNFAKFITTFCTDLENIVKANRGVVDKFTGDGILAFFPEFFSGEDAGFLAIKASEEANVAFKRRYSEFRQSFSTVLLNVGLGTGIDYGNVHMVRMAGSLTIVGQPVVYACRLGGAPAGHIYINQPAFTKIHNMYKSEIELEETEINIKSEGPILCYSAKIKDQEFKIKKPTWI